MFKAVPNPSIDRSLVADPARIIVLNGASSSGKTSLAKAMQVRAAWQRAKSTGSIGECATVEVLAWLASSPAATALSEVGALQNAA